MKESGSDVVVSSMSFSFYQNRNATTMPFLPCCLSGAKADSGREGNITHGEAGNVATYDTENDTETQFG